MPVYRNPMEKGRLVLHFDVKFPEKDELRPESLSKLEKLLPQRTPFTRPPNAEECALVEYDPRQSQRSYRHDIYDDGPGSHEGPTQVNCATH